jgi:hypothetical protein
MISNTYLPDSRTKTSTTQAAQGGLLDPLKALGGFLGIGRNAKFGGGTIHKPTTPAPQQSSPTSFGPLPTTTGGLVSQPQQSYSQVPKTVVGSSAAAPLPQIAPQTTPIKGMVTPPTAAKTTPSNSFQGIVNSLINTSSPTKTQTGLLSDIQKGGKRSSEIGGDAKAIADKYAAEINRVGQLGAGAVAGNLSTGTNVVGSGNAAIASQSASSRIEALANALTSELSGNQQALTGNESYIAALTNALGGANTQQQLTQSGLGSAATYAQPSTAGYGQTVFDPLTGTFTGGSDGLNPQAVATQLADQVRSGRMTYEQAVSSLGYAGGAGQQFLNNALGPGFNPAFSSATIAGQAGVLQQLPQLEAADVAAEGIKNKITTYLTDNPQLNPSAIAKANVLQQWIEGKQLSDAKYQTLFNYLNEYTNTLAPILGVGGDPTNLKTEIAQSFINAAASGASIAEVLENMQGLSRGKLQDFRSGAMGGGVMSNPNTGGGTGTGGLYSF